MMIFQEDGLLTNIRKGNTFLFVDEDDFVTVFVKIDGEIRYFAPEKFEELVRPSELESRQAEMLMALSDQNAALRSYNGRLMHERDSLQDAVVSALQDNIEKGHAPEPD